MRAKFLPADFFSGQSGFTVIEVLVAITILAVGLLALAGVQVGGMRSTDMAAQRTQAVMAAMDMADRMRANKQGVNDNNYAAIASPPAAPAPASCVGAGSNCTPAQIAARDAFDWLSSLAAERDLPRAEGAVACIDSNPGDADPCTDGSMHQITVRWDGRHNGATGKACNPSNPNDKICYRVLVQP